MLPRLKCKLVYISFVHMWMCSFQCSHSCSFWSSPSVKHCWLGTLSLSLSLSLSHSLTHSLTHSYTHTHHTHTLIHTHTHTHTHTHMYAYTQRVSNKLHNMTAMTPNWTFLKRICWSLHLPEIRKSWIQDTVHLLEWLDMLSIIY